MKRISSEEDRNITHTQKQTPKFMSDLIKVASFVVY